jgi:hypothetical protein
MVPLELASKSFRNIAATTSSSCGMKSSSSNHHPGERRVIEEID